jgi:hypothetical protein
MRSGRFKTFPLRTPGAIYAPGWMVPHQCTSHSAVRKPVIWSLGPGNARFAAKIRPIIGPEPLDNVCGAMG